MAQQSQLKRDDMLNEAQNIAYNEHMKEVTGHQQQQQHQQQDEKNHHDSSLLEKSGEQVKTLAQGAARGAIYMKEGAASFGHGVANAVSNTFGSSKQNKSN